MHIPKKYIFLEVYINVNYIETIQSKLKKKNRQRNKITSNLISHRNLSFEYT